MSVLEIHPYDADRLPPACWLRVTWREEGDLGRNPLMGYVARNMPESQGAQMAEDLEKLRYIF